MKSSSSNAEKTWQSLRRLASKAPVEESSEIPFGFATRIVSQMQLHSAESIWLTSEKFAWRGAVLAGLITLAAFAIDYPLLTDLWSGDTPLAGSFVELLSSP